MIGFYSSESLAGEFVVLKSGEIVGPLSFEPNRTYCLRVPDGRCWSSLGESIIGRKSENDINKIREEYETASE